SRTSRTTRCSWSTARSARSRASCAGSRRRSAGGCSRCARTACTTTSPGSAAGRPAASTAWSRWTTAGSTWWRAAGAPRTAWSWRPAPPTCTSGPPPPPPRAPRWADRRGPLRDGSGGALCRTPVPGVCSRGRGGSAGPAGSAGAGPAPLPAGGIRDVSETHGTIRAFLLDDHDVVRRGITALLGDEDDIEVVGEAATAAEAVARIPAARPDVAVLDVRLPDGSGVEVCREVRSRLPDLACLMLTSYADDDALYDAVMAGAAGYVLKQIHGSDL